LRFGLEFAQVAATLVVCGALTSFVAAAPSQSTGNPRVTSTGTCEGHEWTASVPEAGAPGACEVEDDDDGSDGPDDAASMRESQNLPTGGSRHHHSGVSARRSNRADGHPLRGPPRGRRRSSARPLDRRFERLHGFQLRHHPERTLTSSGLFLRGPPRVNSEPQ
jgi:hypothetical protein